MTARVIELPRLDAHLARRLARYADLLVCEMARRRTRLAAIDLGPPERFGVAYGWANVRRFAAARSRRPGGVCAPAVYVITRHAAGWVRLDLAAATQPERTDQP